MSGRLEKDMKIEKKIEQKLVDAPDVLRLYMLNMKNRDRTALSRWTYLGYLSDFTTYLTENKINFKDVKPMHIDNYIDCIRHPNGLSGKTNGPSIINGRMSAINSFFEFLIENEYMIKNPCRNFRPLKVEEKEKVVYMTPEEIHEVKDEIRKQIRKGKKYAKRDLAIITLGTSTGLRVSAIANIDISDIDFVNGLIEVVEKGNRKRTMIIGEKTKDAILDWMIDREKILKEKGIETDALFISALGRRCDRTTISDIIAKNTKCLDKHISPHKMRSTCGMNLYDKTGDIYLVQQQLGHSNIRNTQIYAKATEEKRRKAANILDEI